MLKHGKLHCYQMPIIDKILSFTKRHSKVYNKYLQAWLDVRENKNVVQNIDILYECLLYEQKEKINFKCLEHFISNNVAHSLLAISETSDIHKVVLYKFLADSFVIFPDSAKLEKGISIILNFLFKKKDPLSLQIALVLSESIIENKEIMNAYIGNESYLIDFLFEFVFSPGKSGEISQAALSYIFSVESEHPVEYLKRKNYLFTYIKSLNAAFVNMDINYNQEHSRFYNSGLTLLSIIAKKYRTTNPDIDVFEMLEFGSYKNSESMIKYWIDIISKQSDLEIAKKIVYHIFSSNILQDMVKDKNIHLNICSLFKHILMTHPFLSIDYFIPFNVKEKVSSTEITNFTDSYDQKTKQKFYPVEKLLALKNLLDIKYQSESKIITKDHNHINLFNMLIDNKIYDFDLYAILLIFSKRIFFSYFKEIKSMLLDLEKEEDLFNLTFVFSI